MSEELLPEGPMLLYFWKKSYQKMISNYEEWIPDYEECITDFNALDIGNLEQNEFVDLFFNFEELVKKKRLKKPGEKFVMIGGEKVSRQQLIEISNKPEGYFTLFAKIERITKRMETTIRIIKTDAKTALDFLKLFTFNSEGNIIVEEFVYEDIKAACSYYVKKEKSKKMAVFATAFEKFMSEHDISDLMYSREGYGEFITSILYFASGASNLSINYDYIKRTEY